jgi:AcrR family transcriptional regulator
MDGTPTSAQRLLSRAIEIIQEKGEAAVRVWDIAEDCGVTAPTIYRSFGNREGLVIAAQAERYRRAMALGEQLEAFGLAAATSEEEFRERVAALEDLVLSRQRENFRRVRLSVLGSAIARPDLLAAVVAVDLETAEIIARDLEPAQRNGWIREDLDLLAFSAWYISTVTGRATIEFPGADINADAWDDLTRTALHVNLFGDKH